MTLFCENVLFCHGFKNDTAIFAFTEYTSVQYEMEEKINLGQKSGRAGSNACPLVVHWAQKVSALLNRP